MRAHLHFSACRRRNPLLRDSSRACTLKRAPRLAGTLAAMLLIHVGCRRAEPLQVFNTVPGFTLTAQSGQPLVSMRELAGNVWIADFIYTSCPGPCPRLSRQMKQIQTALESEKDVRLVSFTIDPKNDTPDQLAAYAKRYAADTTRWFFLTGDPEVLQKLCLETFMLGTISGNLDHSTRFVLVDRQSRVRKYYESTDSGVVSSLIDDARSLLHASPDS